MAKKFERRVPLEKWTLERTYQRRSQVDKDIAEGNRMLNDLDRHIKHLIKTIKPVLCKKIGNKWRYRRQLELQIKEIRDEQTAVNR